MTPWTEIEDDMIRAHFPERGAKWRGWWDLLPGRPARSIAARARKLLGPEEDPRERDVSELMALGMSVEDIDRRLGWEAGTARKLATRSWRKGEG